MASTRLKLKKLEDERKSDLAIDALRIAMMNREQVPAESVMRLQGTARAFQDISAYNPEFGLRVNDQLGPNKVTRLMYAASIGNEARVLALIRQGAKRNLISSDGRTALFYAVEEQHLGVIRVLLEAPIPFGSPPEQPIFNAREYWLSPIKEAMFQLNKNIRRYGNFPYTDRSYEILTFLINAAPPGEFKNERYLENLFFSDKQRYFEPGNTFIERHLVLAQMIVDKGSKLSSGPSDDSDEGDLLHILVARNFIRFVDFVITELRKRGKTINYTDPDRGRSILAEISGNYNDDNDYNFGLEMCRYLLSKGADANVLQDGTNESVLLHLIKKFDISDRPRTLQIIREILDSSAASINVFNTEDGNTPLLAAMDNSREDIITLLLERGADPALAILERARHI